jgi:hypothetical protein
LSDLGFEELRWTFPSGQEFTAQAVEISEPGVYHILGEKHGCTSAGILEVKHLSETPFHNYVLYPNPTSTGDFQLVLELDKAGEVEILLHSAAGHLIRRHLLHGRRNIIYNGLITGAPGTYIISAKAHGQSISIPLIYR